VSHEKLSAHIGRFPVVMVTPYDSLLINDGSEERRKFVDNTLSQVDREYLENRELIHQKRSRFSEEWQPFLVEYYGLISGESETVNIKYNSQLNECGFAKLLNESLEKDRLLQRTTTGVHRDDIEFTIEGHPLKKFGSQGQQKSFILALKMAQYQIIRKIKNHFPLLLLDDIFGQLDDDRIRNSLSCLLSDEFGQIFITDTDQNRMERIFDEKHAEIEIFLIEKGKIKTSEFHEAKNQY